MFPNLLTEVSEIQFGQRKPTHYPEWVTLHVQQGGFATLIPKSLRKDGNKNLYYLSHGFHEMITLFEEKQYMLEYPEQGVLLTLVFLYQHGEKEKISTLLEHICPYLSELQFYPSILSFQVTEKVFKLNSSQLSTLVEQRIEKKQRQTKRIRHHVCRYDSQYYLVPFKYELLNGLDRMLSRSWTLQEAKDLWSQLDTMCVRYHSQHRYFRPFASNGSIRLIRQWILKFIQKKGLLNDIDFQSLEGFMKKMRTKYPGPELKKIQIPPSPLDVSDELLIMKELNGMNPKIGLSLEKIQGISTQIQDAKLLEWLQDSKAMDIQEAVDSSESLDQISDYLKSYWSQVDVFSCSSSALKYLYQQLMISFRNRRSILLFHLQSQIGSEEIPWIHMLSSFLSLDENSKTSHYSPLLKKIIYKFPYRMFPNVFIENLKYGYSLPFVKEIAHDIFESNFSKTFLQQYQRMKEKMSHSIYARYYHLEWETCDSGTSLYYQCAKLRNIPVRCYYRSVKNNAKILEQAYLLTSFNLILLFSDIFSFQMDWKELILTTWDFMLHKTTDRIEMANAWRHLLFYFSFMDSKDQWDMFSTLKELKKRTEVSLISTHWLMYNLKLCMEGNRSEKIFYAYE